MLQTVAMDFHELLNVADSNKYDALNEASVKRYSTTFTAPKKPLKSGVQSGAIVRFLAKKKLEEEKKALEAQKKKEELLALRSQNTKNSKKAKIMASRTKDNDFSRIKLTDDEVEAKKKREAEILRMQLDDKVARMKARIEMEEQEMLAPRKRKRKSKHGDTAEEGLLCDEDPKYTDNVEVAASGKKMPKKLRKEMELEAILAEMAAEKKRKTHSKDVNKKSKPPSPQTPYTNFHDLLQLASQKQYEPVKLPKVEATDSDNRPLTKKQRVLYHEEQARVQRKLGSHTQSTAPLKPSISSKIHKAQTNVPVKSKNFHNDKVIDHHNNNTVRKNTHQENERMISKNQKPQYNTGQANERPSQKEFSIPKKSLSQKQCYSPKPETSSVSPSIHSTPPVPKLKKSTNSENYSLNNVQKSRSTGNVQNQITKSGAISRKDIQYNTKSNSHSSLSHTEHENHTVIVPKQQINGVSKKVKEQQKSTDKPLKKLIHNSSETSLRTEKGSIRQSGKNLKHSFNKENPTPKQQMKRVHEREDDEVQSLDDLFAPGETLIRTEKGSYVVQSSKNLKHIGNKGNVLSPCGPTKTMKKDVQEHMRGNNSGYTQMSSTKKSNAKIHSSPNSFNQGILDKAKQFQSVVSRTKAPDDRLNLGKYEVANKESSKMSVNPSVKGRSNSLSSSVCKNVLPKHSPQSEKMSKKVTSSVSANVLSDRRTPPGKVAPVSRPVSAKEEMMKRPGMPPRPGIPSHARPSVPSRPGVPPRPSVPPSPSVPPRPSVHPQPSIPSRSAVPPVKSSSTSAGKRSVPSTRPFHINPYLDAPRRLLEPLIPQKPRAKRYEIDSEEDDEDDDMSDFIDDGPCFDDTDYSKHIKEIFRYDRTKYYDDDDDDDDYAMETPYSEQLKEEMRSAKLGKMEDQEDMRKEEEERKRKKLKKKRLK